LPRLCKPLSGFVAQIFKQSLETATAQTVATDRLARLAAKTTLPLMKTCLKRSRRPFGAGLIEKMDVLRLPE
jgi:hypothetical protein